MGGHISGGQYNPAVALGVFLRGAQGYQKMFTVMIAQCLGALVGGSLALEIAQPMSWSAGAFKPFTSLVHILYVAMITEVAVLGSRVPRQEPYQFRRQRCAPRGANC